MKHLHRDRWMRRSTAGNWMLKRVSAAGEKQFPRKYRELLAKQSATKTVLAIMQDNNMTLSQAWDELKRMCNTGNTPNNATN